MTTGHDQQTPQPRDEHTNDVQPDETPDKVPPKAWVTLGLFAAFVVLFFTCANTFMFN